MTGASVSNTEEVTCKVCGARVPAECGRYAARLMWSHKTPAGERCTAAPQDCETDAEVAARLKREAERTRQVELQQPGQGIDWTDVLAKSGKTRGP
jgi:hypothetical protein